MYLLQTHSLGPPVIGIGYNAANDAAKAVEQKNRKLATKIYKPKN